MRGQGRVADVAHVGDFDRKQPGLKNILRPKSEQFYVAADVRVPLIFVAVVRQIEKAIPCLPAGYHAKHGITVHGTDLQSSDEFTDETEKTHGDVFTVAMGVSQ